jgi:hypothetical protein
VLADANNRECDCNVPAPAALLPSCAAVWPDSPCFFASLFAFAAAISAMPLSLRAAPLITRSPPPIILPTICCAVPQILSARPEDCRDKHASVRRKLISGAQCSCIMRSYDFAHMRYAHYSEDMGVSKPMHKQFKIQFELAFAVIAQDRPHRSCSNKLATEENCLRLHL